MPKLVIVVRQSPDWSTMTPDRYLAQLEGFCQEVEHPPTLVLDLVNLWNDTFETSFFQARQRMKEIATANWRSVAGARIVDSKPGLSAMDLDADVVCFVDDDDWFRPDLGDHFPSPADCDAFVWRHAAFGRHEGPAITLRDDDGFIYTNNYAVTSSFLRNPANTLSGVFQHTAAYHTLADFNVVRIPEVLSITNKHAASIMFLEQSLRDRLSKENLVQAVQNYLAKITNDRGRECDQTAWARPLMQHVIACFSEL